MGGLLDIVIAFGALITARSVQQAYFRSLLSEAYQVQDYAADQSEFYESRKARMCMQGLDRRSKSLLSLSEQLENIELTSHKSTSSDSSSSS